MYVRREKWRQTYCVACKYVEPLSVPSAPTDPQSFAKDQDSGRGIDHVKSGRPWARCFKRAHLRISRN